MTMAAVAIGLRLALGGRGRGRLAVTAAGVGVGVALLLTALAVGPALEARQSRERAREPVGPMSHPSAGSYLLQSAALDRFHGRRLLRIRLAPVGEDPPLLPGLARLPGPGEIAASPELAELLRSPEGALLRPRLPGRVVATIGKEGLAWPGELLSYSGAAPTDATEAAGFAPVASYGHPEGSQRELAAEIKLVVLIAALALLLPTLTFIAASSRVAAAARERRLAAIRLVGATPTEVRVLSAVEALPGALLGCLIGVVLFLFLRPFAPSLAPPGYELFASDLTPPLAQVLATLLAVPLLAVGASLLALRRVELSPLGIVRRARVRRTGPTRVLPLALGFALLGVACLQRRDAASTRGDDLLGFILAGSGFTLIIVGITTVTPWLSVLAAQLLVRRARHVSTLIGARRLLLEPTASARLVSGAALAVFAAGVAHAFLPPLLGAAESEREVVAAARPGTVFVGTAASPARVVSALRGVAGVKTVAPLGSVSALGSASVGREAHPSDVLVADCAALNRVLVRPLPGCGRAQGWRLVPRSPYAPVIAPAAELRLLVDPDRTRETVAMRLPRALTPASARPLFGDDVAVLLPQAAVPAPAALRTRLGLVATDGDVATVERVRNALDRAAIRADVASGSEYVGTQGDEIRGVVGLIDLATLLVFAIAAAGLLVASIDSVLERRRPLAVLAAVGAPLASLRRSVLVQSGIPLVCGLGVAASAALGTSALLLAVNGSAVVLPLAALGALIAAMSVVSLAAVALTLPTLSRAVRPEALRTE